MRSGRDLSGDSEPAPRHSVLPADHTLSDNELRGGAVRLHVSPKLALHT